ncbi:MAG: divalent-cation tolerance protein CutA [Candidatus Doudnabacteria bacterium]|nr:divalent-cation tolerance protein CutA [Candidatus Doudnabacteria bacterium]
MAEREIIWVVVSTTSSRQADKIGLAVLKKHLCACYSIMPRQKAVYFWPPESNKVEISRGPLLVLETMPKMYNKIVDIVKEMHSEEIPFIGQWEMENVEKNFYKWLVSEVGSRK